MKSLESVESYLGTLNVQHIAMSGLRAVITDYEKTAEELDVRALELEAQLKSINGGIELEQGGLREVLTMHNWDFGSRLGFSQCTKAGWK